MRSINSKNLSYNKHGKNNYSRLVKSGILEFELRFHSCNVTKQEF